MSKDPKERVAWHSQICYKSMDIFRTPQYLNHLISIEKGEVPRGASPNYKFACFSFFQNLPVVFEYMNTFKNISKKIYKYLHVSEKSRNFVS